MPVSHTSPPDQPLQESPTARTFTVRQLLSHAESGRIRVPEFQRPLRWRLAQNLELLDSVWRNYPIGSLLFWSKPAEAGKVHIGAASIDVSVQAQAFWVVDGQQRVTALAASLLDIAQPPGERRWELFFDVAVPGFTTDATETTIPVRAFGDLRRFGRHLREAVWADDEDLVYRAELAQQRLLDYEIPAYVVEADDEGALKAIFTRLNSTGARMRSDEVFHALLGTRGSEAVDLGRLQQVFEGEEFGTPTRSETLKMVLAMSEHDPTKGVERFSERDLSRLVEQSTAEETVRQVIGFLRSDAGIPHLRLVPYPVVLTILARWFCRFPDASTWSRKRLAWWLWSGAATAAHQRAEVSKMRDQLRFIADKEGDSIDRLLKAVDPPSGLSNWELKRFNGQSAHSRIEMATLLRLKPRSLPHEEEGVWLESREIAVGALVSQGRVAREIIASTDWKRLSEDHRRLAQSGANRVLLEEEEGHTGLGSRFRTLSFDSDRAILESHLMNEVAFSRLCQRDYEGFLEARASDLCGHVSQALASLTGRHPPAPRYMHLVEEYLEEDNPVGES